MYSIGLYLNHPSIESRKNNAKALAPFIDVDQIRLSLPMVWGKSGWAHLPFKVLNNNIISTLHPIKFDLKKKKYLGEGRWKDFRVGGLGKRFFGY